MLNTIQPTTGGKTVFFIGIGGIGMSGIAEVMHNLGYKVSGSDLNENALTKRLKNLGIEIFHHHSEEHVENAFVVVISSAIREENPEIQKARKLKIPIIQRAEMLAELMRLRRSVAISGTHGKTTTTSLMASLFDAAGFDPTVVNGGIINAYNNNVRLGGGDWIIVEADESDGSFTKLFPTIAVVTNIDPEHMEHYGSFDRLEKAFLDFIHHIPFYGLAILCIDHPVVEKIALTLTDRRFITYGFSEKAMIRAVHIRRNVNHTVFDVEIRKDYYKYQDIRSSSLTDVVTLPFVIRNLELPMLGLHNVQNALALVAVALELEISEKDLRQALLQFKGVKRRFTVVGQSHGVTIIDDYAHHPEEIKTVIQSARQASPNGQLIAVVQPHRYTRLKALFNDFLNCFEGCAHVVILPVYSAGEAEISGTNSQELVKALKQTIQIPVHEVSKQSDLVALLPLLCQQGDLVLMMGAGDITHWASVLPAQLDTVFCSQDTKAIMI